MLWILSLVPRKRVTEIWGEASHHTQQKSLKITIKFKRSEIASFIIEVATEKVYNIITTVPYSQQFIFFITCICAQKYWVFYNTVRKAWKWQNTLAYWAQLERYEEKEVLWMRSLSSVWQTSNTCLFVQ